MYWIIIIELSREPITFIHLGRYNMDNDIALIRLKTPVTLSEYVNVICLPAENDYYPPHTNASVAGWGRVGKCAACCQMLSHCQ